MNRTLVAAFWVVAMLAGCTGSNSEPGANSPAVGSGDGTGGVGAALAAPQWAVGQAWTLQSDQLSAPFSHVVSGESGDDWIVDTDNAEVAFFDARSDISFLGKVGKSNLAGSQGSNRIEFFQFPLTLHKNWTTTWDQQDVRVQVTQVADGTARLEARLANGTPYASYTYEDRLGYFREYTFYGADGVSVSFAAKVTGTSLSFTGELVRWSLSTQFETHGPMAANTVQSFTVGPDVTDVYVEASFACSAGAFNLVIAPAEGAVQQRGFAVAGPCPATVIETGTAAAPGQDEQWVILLHSVPPMESTLDLLVLLRTQVLFGVGAAPV